MQKRKSGKVCNNWRRKENEGGKRLAQSTGRAKNRQSYTPKLPRLVAPLQRSTQQSKTVNKAERWQRAMNEWKSKQINAQLLSTQLLPSLKSDENWKNLLWQFSLPFADNEICQFQLCQATLRQATPSQPKRPKTHQAAGNWNVRGKRQMRSSNCPRPVNGIYCDKATVRQMCQFYVK